MPLEPTETAYVPGPQGCESRIGGRLNLTSQNAESPQERPQPTGRTRPSPDTSADALIGGRLSHVPRGRGAQCYCFGSLPLIFVFSPRLPSFHVSFKFHFHHVKPIRTRIKVRRTFLARILAISDLAALQCFLGRSRRLVVDAFVYGYVCGFVACRSRVRSVTASCNNPPTAPDRTDVTSLSRSQ